MARGARSPSRRSQPSGDTSKPVVFFSHSARDGEALLALKSLFVEKTGGSIAVFLSSDGQSIAVGRNWVSEVEGALASARIAFVFLTRHAVASRWVFFESGFMYAKGIRVIPVGFMDFDLAVAPAPISLLQGFNVTSEKALDNLIAVANEEFGHQHRLSFTADEFGRLQGLIQPGSADLAARYAEHVQQALIEAVVPPDRFRQALREVIDADRLPHAIVRDDLVLPNIAVTMEGLGALDASRPIGQERPSVRAKLSFGLDEDTDDALLNRIYVALRRAGDLRAARVRVQFDDDVEFLFERRAIAARLAGSRIELDPVSGLRFEGMPCDVYSDASEPPPSARHVGLAWVSLEVEDAEIPVRALRRCIQILFDRKVLRLRSRQAE